MENLRQWLPLWGFSLFLMTVAVLALDFPELFFDRFPFLCRMMNEALLLIGFVGSVRGSQHLRVVGWIGICLFIVYVTLGSIPSLDHSAFDAHGNLRPQLWMARLALWLALSAALIVSFRKLANPPS